MAEGTARDAGARRRFGVGAVVVLGLGALALTVGVGIVRGVTAPQDVLPLPAVTETGPSSPEVFVHVSGAVRTPGLFRLTTGAKVVDAIAAAGGFADDADRSAVNLARDVKDGEQIQVAVIGGTPAVPGAPGGGAGGSAAGGGLINLNTAGIAELDELPRIGPALAQRIVEWREQNGGFTSVEDLLSVPGIGEKLVAGLRDRATV